jgi:hypothetical protein
MAFLLSLSLIFEIGHLCIFPYVPYVLVSKELHLNMFVELAWHLLTRPVLTGERRSGGGEKGEALLA